MSDEDLFGSDDELPKPQPTSVPEDDQLFGSDDDEAPVVKPRRQASKLNNDDDEEENDMEVSRGGDDEGGDESGGPKDELDDLFGEEEGGSYAGPTSEVRKHSTSTLRITRTEQLPDKCRSMLVRMPNILKIQETAFDPDSYSKEEDIASLGRMAMGIRWRPKLGADGQPIKGADGVPEVESNARLVKFKNGSMQIVVGSESYDFFPQSVDNRFVRQFFYLVFSPTLPISLSFSPFHSFSNVISVFHFSLDLKLCVSAKDLDGRG